MPLKNTNTIVPGGWVYAQNDNAGKFVKKFKGMNPFREFCSEILKVRQANKFDRATLEQVMEDVDEYQCQRLGFNPTYVKKKAVTFSPAKLFSPTHLRGAAQAAIGIIGGVANATVILTRWLGSGGKPVDSDISQRRADVCNTVAQGQRCPFNETGFTPTERIAEIIRSQTEEKNKLKLSVKGEETLGVCTICHCDLKLKVHVPMQHILSGTPQPMLMKFKREQPRCWMVTESEKPATDTAT